MEITSACIIDNDYTDEYPTQRWLIVASTEQGEVYQLMHSFDDRYKAEKLLQKIRHVGKIDLQYWAFWRTIYGSPAYEQQGY